MWVREPSAKNVKKKKFVGREWSPDYQRCGRNRGSAISVQRRSCDFQIILCTPLLKREALSLDLSSQIKVKPIKSLIFWIEALVSNYSPFL